MEIKAHQRLVKERTRKEDLAKYGVDIFLAELDEYTFQREEPSEEAKTFLLRYEWLASWGISPRWILTARVRGVLAGIVCINLPNAFSKILGEGTAELECLIQRGATSSFAHPHLGSKLVRWACNWMVQNTDKRIIYGYADVGAGFETGTIYQSCSFEFLGWSFGTKFMCAHPEFKNGQPFSPQSLRRTALWKRLYKEWHGRPLPKEYLNPKSGFKDMKAVERICPKDKADFYEYGNRIIAESKRIPVATKGKYVLVLGKDRREQRALNARKTYKPKPYPKKTDPKVIQMYLDAQATPKTTDRIELDDEES